MQLRRPAESHLYVYQLPGVTGHGSWDNKVTRAILNGWQISGITVFRVVKNISMGKQVTLQFLAEFFDFLSDINYSPPATVLGASSFGVVSSAADARTVQLGQKVLY